MLEFEKGKAMKHWNVRAKAVGAKAEQFNWLGGSLRAAWRLMLIISGCIGLGAIVAHLKGVEPIINYAVGFAVAVSLVVVLSSWTTRFVIDLVPCSTEKLKAAYEDQALRKWIRVYAVTQLRDDALAKGADGWVIIWEEKRQALCL